MADKKSRPISYWFKVKASFVLCVVMQQPSVPVQLQTHQAYNCSKTH